MAIKNLQTLVQCAANIHGVRVTGTSKDSMRAEGVVQAFLSLPRLALAEPFSAGTSPENGHVLRAGRSARRLGVMPGARTSTAYQRKPASTARATRMWPMTILVLG